MNIQVNYRGGRSTINGGEFGVTDTTSEEVIRNIICDIYEMPSSIFRDPRIERGATTIIVDFTARK